MNRMEKMLELEEEEKGNIPEKFMRNVNPTSAALRFMLLYLSNDDNQTIHKVEVRNKNFQDLTRHLQRGESVFITPELLEKSSKHMKNKKDLAPWYFNRV
jgi:hypothetical protein